MLINKAVCRIASIYVSLAGLCLLIPWLLPVQEAQSESYALGFSNQGFLACLLVLFHRAGILPQHIYVTILSRWVGQRLERNSIPLRSRYEVVREAWASFVLASAPPFFWRILATWRVMENQRDFLLRSALAEAGKVPYRDFEFAYGPRNICLRSGLAEVVGVLRWVCAGLLDDC